MVVDTSAILAVLFHEPDATTFESRLLDEPRAMLSAGSLLECAIVVEARKGPNGARELDRLLNELGVDVVAVEVDQIAAARRGYRRYGKGRHAAGLNYGDCFAYGLAIALDAPLLFKGEDFSKTDVRDALSG